ncbi:alpha/beta fold hydrolase [Haloechinothrix halophila]|uniref:alpha/beta fold hydrolase n=1 Tax=Haloechinothrix halophila TaxID=1069073 RepID=UPI0003F913FA|nr:alpha/beta hydrolase [Haloechinothrix halophila]
MPEQFAEGVNGVDVCYETFGPPDGEPLLLIMGLSAPMIWWDDEFCQLLAERGFHTIRFDNRDCGRSSSIGGAVSLPAAYLGRKTAYSLDDMSDDTAELLTRLGVASAHVVGASLGGMIGQVMAIRHPDRVRSLTSIMSHTGNRLVWRPHHKAVTTLLTAPPRDRDSYIAHHLRMASVIGSPAYPADEKRLRTRAERTFDRGLNRAGTARQLAAALAAQDRTPQLKRLRVPTSAIHGADDLLINVGCGLATVRAIPGAELHVINGMGHDLPEPLWPRFADMIEQTARRATAVA